MILSLCIITKGDEELSSVKKAVGSVINYVDSVYITTNSKEISKTKKWCAMDARIKHSHLDWNKDFATMRNFNFSQVRSDTDYIVWMDSDDVIVRPDLLGDVAKLSKKNGIDAVFFPYWYGARFDGEPSLDTLIEVEISHNRERLIRPGSVAWKKRIHETPVPLDPENYVYSMPEYKEFPIAWLHLGAERDITPERLEARNKRNTEFLELQLKDERAEGEADPRTLLYLMRSYVEGGVEEKFKEVLEMGHEYLQKSGWDLERGSCYQIMSKCCGLMGQHKKAKELILGAIEEYPTDPLNYFYLARACFNLKEYAAMKHWMDVGFNIDPQENKDGLYNALELQVITHELMFNYQYHVKRDIRAAHKAAELLARIKPDKTNYQNEFYTANLAALDRAAENAVKLSDYFVDIQRETFIPEVIKSLPDELQSVPALARRKLKYSQPRVWGEKSVCYYASFGGEHFEKWDGNSLKKGIGGSETAVIRLAEEWTKKGYEVVVYGDPLRPCVINGVAYLPWYEFNPKDKFNIFIQWRQSGLAGKISAKKFLVDLHDVFHSSTHEPRIDSIDRLMVKSNFHKDFAEGIDEDKLEVISNGIK